MPPPPVTLRLVLAAVDRTTHMFRKDSRLAMTLTKQALTQDFLVVQFPKYSNSLFKIAFVFLVYK